MSGRSRIPPPGQTRKKPPQRIPTPMPAPQNKSFVSTGAAVKHGVSSLQQHFTQNKMEDFREQKVIPQFQWPTSIQKQDIHVPHKNEIKKSLKAANRSTLSREKEQLCERNNRVRLQTNEIYEKHALNRSTFQPCKQIEQQSNDEHHYKQSVNSNRNRYEVITNSKPEVSGVNKIYPAYVESAFAKPASRIPPSVNNDFKTYSQHIINGYAYRSNSVLSNNYNYKPTSQVNNSVNYYGVNNSVRDSQELGFYTIDFDSVQAQALAAAAFFARAAQRLSGSNRRRGEGAVDKGGFCGALQRAPPPVPPALMRRLANRETSGVGKVKVMLRVSGSPTDGSFIVDKKKRQVTLSDPQGPPQPPGTAPAAQDRLLGVAAPKMFAFDAIFNQEDTQGEVCGAALSDVVHAVLEGADGCLLALGHPGAGQTHTMLGTPSTSAQSSTGSPGGLGAIPCAISWLFRGISERRQRSGARFSVRVSAIGVGGPGTQPADLLAAHATESDESPGVYLREDLLGGPTELRAPTAERAALFLDAALACRASTHGPPEPALLFTLHVYQYSLAGKGGVAGGRSRLHLIDLGGCGGRGGGMPLSGVGNVLLAILSGQRHPPHRDHPLTPLLRDCLAPLTCHVTVVAHVSGSQNYTDALTTVQVASRVHRMRRRKIRFPMATGASGTGGGSGGEDQRTGSEPDPSSSDLSADTVIYVGPADEATDGEHPPVYLPSLNSGDNRCAMGKALRGSAAEIRPSRLPKPASTKAEQKTDTKCDSVVKSSPSAVKTTPKGSPVKRPLIRGAAGEPASPARSQNASIRSAAPSASDEQWIDGPRVSKSRVAEARHFLKEANHIKQRETWIDGPLQAGATGATGATASQQSGYGFMDSHKKSMIRQWVENQSTQLQGRGKTSPARTQQPYREMTQFKTCEPDEILEVTPLSETVKKTQIEESVVRTGLQGINKPANTITEASEAQEAGSSEMSLSKPELDVELSMEEEEEDSEEGPSEVPPALPLIQPLSSREVSVESLAGPPYDSMDMDESGSPVPTQDCCLQVTEEDIARCMAGTANSMDMLLSKDHPLRALSQDNITVISSFADNTGIYDTFSECEFDENSRRQFDQLAKLRELFQSQLAMAEVTPHYRLCDTASIYSEPPYRHTDGAGSIYSEPAYRPSSPLCRGCQKSMSRTDLDIETKSNTFCYNYSSLRHPDGASDPNLQERIPASGMESDLKKPLSTEMLVTELTNLKPVPSLPTLTPLLAPQATEAYDSGHESTPRTSKHSGISRRAESGYDSVASSLASGASVHGHRHHTKGSKIKYKYNHDNKSFCSWLRNPFTCTYPDTDPEVSDF